MSSPYIRDYRQYNTANQNPIVIQRPNYQVGDIILVIYNSGNWSNERLPSLKNGFTQLNPHTGLNDEPFNLRVIFYKEAAENEPTSYSISLASSYNRTTVTIMTIANAKYNKVFNNKLTNINLGYIPKDSLVICSLTTQGAPLNPNGLYNLVVNGTMEGESRQHPIYQKSYAANEMIRSAVSSASWNSTYMIYLVFERKNTNIPPTQPGEFTMYPSQNSMNLSSEIVELQWGVSIDKNEDPITYTLEIYNGVTWITVASNIITTSYSTILPTLDTDKAQFRVKAVDSKAGQSNYTLGNVFTIANCLLLVQDNDIVKSFKDGVWKSI
ncbi:hypothetical protein [Bacillus thuringiensis]